MSTTNWDGEPACIDRRTGDNSGTIYANSPFCYKDERNERGPGTEGKDGLPEDKNEPVDLLNDAYSKICIEGAREARRKADSKCLEAVCAICDAMTLVCARMEALQPFPDDEGLASLAEEMAALGDSLAKIRTSMGSIPVLTGHGV